MSAKTRAFVSGGRGALGMAVCRALLEAGYETHAASRSKGKPSGPGGVQMHSADFTNEVDTARVFEEVGGPLAALVSTVGGFAGGALADVKAADIDRLTDLNLKSTALILKHAYPYLQENPGGSSVVLVASRSAVLGGPRAALYAATKAAVVSLAASAAKEWLEDGISVNAILPSTIDTPANRASMPDADFERWPSPDEVARVAALLVSEEARIVSGGAIPVYGRA